MLIIEPNAYLCRNFLKKTTINAVTYKSDF